MTWVRAHAPGRVNLIGEHTDYNAGFALPIALEAGTVVDFEVGGADATIHAGSDRKPDSVAVPLDTSPSTHRVTGWGGYVAGSVWALREFGVAVPAGRMRITSTVPVGAGLSSSAALECAVLCALTAAAGAVVDRTELARIAQRAENEYVGAPTGLLDQLAALYGEPDTALLIDFRSVRVTPVPLESAGGVWLAIDSRSPHRNASGEYADRRRACERAAELLGAPSLRDVADDDWRQLADDELRRRARHVLTENRRVLDGAAALRSGDATGFGALMRASHASMRDDFEITTPAIDLIAATADRLGAYGARMTGGGFGGTVIAFAPQDAADRIAAELPDTVAAAGHPRPGCTRIRPGAGAHLLPDTEPARRTAAPPPVHR
ncbi:galactokinase [Nocardia stercoris]|uniref:Galactokinase n=1 Tax=Nocardia stercoris TaxID=2483361 RepID=A0A3M2LBP8_9NOCA|nr:galactokinase [Nocardia stercoris]RMI34150.1 galactokinase [Nocardia stercoris]